MNPDFLTLFSQHWVVFWDYFFNSKGHHVSPVMSRLAKVSSHWLCLVFFVDVLSVVLNPVAKSPSSFTDVKEIRTQPTLNLVNHILGQACHDAADLHVSPVTLFVWVVWLPETLQSTQYLLHGWKPPVSRSLFLVGSLALTSRSLKFLLLR